MKTTFQDKPLVERGKLVVKVVAGKKMIVLSDGSEGRTILVSPTGEARVGYRVGAVERLPEPRK